LNAINTPESPVAAANASLAAGQPAQAETQFAAIIAADPLNSEAMIGLGHCARARGDQAQALRYFQQVGDLYPQNPWPQLEAAHSLRLLGRAGEAEALCHALLAANQNFAPALIGLAHCARARGDRPTALANFQAAMAAEPEKLSHLLDTAAELLEMQEFGPAETLFRAAVAQAPADDSALRGLLHCLRVQSRFTDALAVLRAAPHAWAALEAGHELLALGRIDEAEAVFGAALEEERGDAVAVVTGLAQCARRRGTPAAALPLLALAVRLHPEAASLRLEWADGLRETGRLAQAQAQYQRAAAGDSAYRAQLGLGLCARAAGDEAAALAAFAAAAAARPDEPGCLVEMAASAHALGRAAECRAALAAARALAPQFLPAIQRQAELAVVAGDLPGALLIYEQALAANPGAAPDLATGRAGVLSAMGRFDDALAALTDAGAAKRVEILRQMGRYDEALAAARAAAPKNFWLCVEHCLTALAAGEVAEAQACLAAMQAATPAERALRARLTGNAAERCWDVAGAIAHYETAAALNPRDAGTRFDLVRARMLQQDLKGAAADLQAYVTLEAPATKLRGKIPSPSQTHFGQMLDEYRMDASLAAALAALQADPPAARLAPLRALVQANPDATGPAVCLLVALRQAGLLDLPPGGGQAIPRQIAQFWDSPEMPADVAALTASWGAQNPGYAVRRFDARSAAAFLAAEFPANVLGAFRRAREPAQKADLFRLAWLVKAGGVYVDADDRCLAPLERILPPLAGFAGYQEDHGTLANNFLAARPGHPVTSLALELAVAAVNRGDSDMIWLATGPGLLTRAFAQVWADGLDDAVILDRRVLADAVAVHCWAGYKGTERHWGNAGRRGKEGQGAWPPGPPLGPEAPDPHYGGRGAPRQQ
jgi:tetratricopeptide (TPR) repeat protein